MYFEITHVAVKPKRVYRNLDYDGSRKVGEKRSGYILEGKINILRNGMIMRDISDDYWVSDLQCGMEN